MGFLNLESLAKLHKFFEDERFKGDELMSLKDVTELRQNEFLINKINHFNYKLPNHNLIHISILWMIN